MIVMLLVLVVAVKVAQFVLIDQESAVLFTVTSVVVAVVHVSE